MRKIAYVLALMISINLIIVNVNAFVDTTKEETSKGEYIKLMTYTDYEPFGAYQENEIQSIFMPELQKFGQKKNYMFSAQEDIWQNEYIDNIRSLRSGKIHMIIGAYHAAKLYNGIQLVYPAVISNPIHVVMMPEKIDSVKTIDDLKGLKGLRIKGEQYNDFAEAALGDYDVQTVDNTYDAYEKIFVGEADYIIGGYYYLLGESLKLGVRPYVSFSKSPLWNFPVFLGISKTARVDRALLNKLLTKWFSDPQAKERVHQNLREYIERMEEKYAGTVPPKFVRKDEENVSSAQEDSAQVTEQVENERKVDASVEKVQE